MVETIKDIEKRIDDLVLYLNECTKLYDIGEPTISDKEWDDLYFELVKLERMTKYIRSDSPTQKINYYTTVDSLQKVEHSHPMLSLDKTKSMDAVASFLGKKPWIAMLKMDGLTCSLLYENGKLVRAETRGNGIIGEDITHNAMVIPSIPKRIPYKETLIVDGEIICKLDDFTEFANTYKNSRNFAAGSIRLLDSSECVKRKLTFVTWDHINKTTNTLSEALSLLNDYGFTVVPYLTHNDIELKDCTDCFNTIAKNLSYPIDGIVFKIDSVEDYEALGRTDHHFKGGLAYKFYDEAYTTYLKDIEWTMGRTGVLTPVAIFDPLDIDGSTVERASIHNISIMKNLFHGNPFKGQKIEVFKANMIIPQIYSAEDISASHHLPSFIPFIEIPNICPVCGSTVYEQTENDTTVLMCNNPSCEGKLINRLDHFCGKKGLDIKGISKATLEKLIEWNWIQNCSDIFKLHTWAGEWVHKPGFGIKSVQKILDAIETSRECELSQFIAALGIPLIGSTASKELTKVFSTWDEFITAVESDYSFYQLPNFGYEMHSAIHHYDYSDAKIIAENYITFKEIQNNINEQILNGQTFVITGKLNRFKNRDEISNLIVSLGGKVTGSVSKNTTYLINNDVNSTSSKNKTAQSLGIPIISEEDFIQTFGIN